jgi:hypothetical protein
VLSIVITLSALIVVKEAIANTTLVLPTKPHASFLTSPSPTCQSNVFEQQILLLVVETILSSSHN